MRLKGDVLLGFASLFTGSYGDPLTPRPYLTVVPARVGGALLPFPCPSCGEERPEPVDPVRWSDYADRVARHSFCPSCRVRYVVDFRGAVLLAPLGAGARSAPAIVFGLPQGSASKSRDAEADFGGGGFGDDAVLVGGALGDLWSWLTNLFKATS